jgi:CheY-like chemotaxis protein
VNKFFLLADDDNDDAELFSEALARIIPPVRFRHVEDGHGIFEFLKQSANIKPDIIFLDLNMPGMSGWQCLSKLKNDIKFNTIPVIMYSTSSNPREKEIAVELGALGFLTKPTDFKVLTKILEQIAVNDLNDLKRILKEILMN